MRPRELILLFDEIKLENVYSVNHPIARVHVVLKIRSIMFAVPCFILRNSK